MINSIYLVIHHSQHAYSIPADVCENLVKMWNKLKLVWSKINRWHRVILIFILVETKLFPGGQVGFQCNDPALSHPYTGDTVSWKWLMGVTLTVPLAVMLIVERQQEKVEVAKRHALMWYKEYVFGFLLNLTFVQSVKLLVGSPRPHFFDTCRPEEARTCEPLEYVSSYTCTRAHWLNQSDKSFPSGHTSLAFHMGIFVVYYLYQRARNLNFRSVLTLQALCMVSASYCAVSRMTDHRHHWWDVLAGFIIGAAILVYTIFHLCRNFECIAPKNEVVVENQRDEVPEITNEKITESK